MRSKYFGVFFAISVIGLWGCSLESPLICGAGTHINADRSACEIDSPVACGSSAFDCTSVNGIAEVNCSLVESVSLCEIKKCSDKYTLVSGQYDKDGKHNDEGIYTGFCVNEDVHHCGEHDIDCEKDKPERADEVVCDPDRHLCRIDSCLSSKDQIRSSKVNGNWLNECVEVTDYGCMEQFCQGQAFDNAERFDCDNTRTGSECLITTCKMGFYLDGNTCLPNDDENCGEKNFNCHQYEGYDHIAEMLCSGSGQCVINKCDDESSFNGELCEEIERECKSDSDCEQVLIQKGYAGVGSSKCNNFICMVTGCQDGYRLEATDEGNICVEQTLSDCSGINCNEIPGFEHGLDGKCDNGVCTVSACADAYHVQSGIRDGNGYTTCESDDAQKCGDAQQNCRDVIDHSVTNVCMDGECHVQTCEVGMHPNPGDDYTSCIKDTVKACGQEAIDCLSEHVASATCVEGKCKLTCERLSHLNKDGTACVVDSATECGTMRKDCTTAISNASETTCEDGQCMVHQCKEGYGPDLTRSACSKDSSTRCGGFLSSCTKIGTGSCENGRCVYTSCKDGYYKNGTNCCIDHLHITDTNYQNNDIVCANYITMEPNVKTITMNNLRTVGQFQTCTKPIGLFNDSPDDYIILVGDNNTGESDCSTNLTKLELPNLETAYGLYLNTYNVDLKFYALKKINWLRGGAKSLYAPMLTAMGEDIDLQMPCDIDFAVQSAYTPRLKSISLLNACIFFYDGNYHAVDWIYPESMTGSVPQDSECIDMVVMPMSNNLCKGFQEGCKNDLGCNP